MDATVLAVFVLVYLGMTAGGLPWLAVDRTGVALLGAIALLAFKKISPEQAWAAVNVPTICVLFGLMVVSAQLRLSGFYAWLAHRLAMAERPPAGLLALLVFAAGGLSAVLANDIVCLAMAPVLIAGCAQRRLDPVPFLLALACGANVGSAATLIGNPQNMLIGQELGVSFVGYMAEAALPAALGLAVVWAVIAWQWRGKWQAATPRPAVEAPALDRWHTVKGLAVIVVLAVLFLFSSWPRDVLALAAAGVLLLSRKMTSRATLAMIDWQLLVLFVGLFVVNRALQSSGMLDTAVAHLKAAGVDVARPGWLFVAAAVLANLVSNVPGVMLLLPATKLQGTSPAAPAILAIASTLAGNFIVVGSIANIIVLTQADMLGVHISWKKHSRTGIPVTILTLALAAGWLWVRS